MSVDIRHRKRPAISSSDSEFIAKKKSQQIFTVGYYLVNGNGVDLNKKLKEKSTFTAINPRDRTIKHCQPLNVPQYRNLTNILQRFEEPIGNGLSRVKEKILPRCLELIQGPKGQTWAFWTPARGPNLHQFVQKQGRLSESQARRVFGQVVQIVALCHSMNIIVRDLKLRKLTFEDRECTTIRLASIDELTSLQLDDTDILTDRFGCPAYAAPELLDTNLHSYSGKAADIWSLGVLFFVMLFGRYPFFAPTATDLFSKIKTAPIQLTQQERLSIGVQTRSLLWDLMKKDPGERPNAQQLLAIFRLQSESSQNVILKTDDLIIITA